MLDRIALSLLLLLTATALPARDVAAYQDPRDISASKAKSDLKQLHKKLTEIEEGLRDKPDKTVARPDWIARRYEDVEKLFARVAEKDPSWDLSREKAFFADLKQKVEVATAAVAASKQDEFEPDPATGALEPIAGAPRMTPMKPDWCDGVTIAPEDKMITKAHYKQFVDLSDFVKPAQHACRAADFGKRQQWSANWRQAIANQTGADAKLISRFYRVMLAVEADAKLRDETCAAFGAVKGNAPQPRSRGGKDIPQRGAAGGQRALRVDQASFHRATGLALGCGRVTVLLDRESISDEDLLWWADRRAEPPSELVRAVVILSRVGHWIGGDPGRAGKYNYLANLGNYALVAADIARLDEARFRRELAAMKLSEYGQVMAELTFKRAQHMGRVFKETYGAMDPGIGKLAFEAPLAGFAAWEKTYAENQAGLELAAEVEAKLLDGKVAEVKDCHAQAHAAFTAYLGRAGAGKSLDDIKALATSGVGGTLLATSLICAGYEGRLGTAWILSMYVMKYAAQARGPRLAAYAATLDAFSAIKSKDQGFPLDERTLAFHIREPVDLVQDATSLTHNKTGIVEEQSGRVKAVKKVKDGLELTFHQEKRQVPIYDCVETNKIARIDADGTVHYRTICTPKGEKTVDVTTKPFVVPTAFAAGIAPGVTVTAWVEGSDKGRMGIPGEVTDGKKQLVAYLGALR